MKISIVIPVSNEEESIPILNERLFEALKNLKCEGELIYVDDGSRDGTLKNLKALRENDDRVKIISFSRNFGQQYALLAGLETASGDAVITMDADLQHPPELIESLVDHWKRGSEIVTTRRESQGSIFSFKHFSSTFFYRLFRWLSPVPLPLNSGEFRLMDRKVVQAFLQFQESHRFNRGLIAWLGFKSVEVRYHAGPRVGGQTKYTKKRMTEFALDAILSFSSVPLYALSYLGFLFLLLGAVYFAHIFYVYFFTTETVPGWTSVISLILAMGGLQMVFMGALGMYVGRIYEEVKRRPLFVVREKIGFDSNDR